METRLANKYNGPIGIRVVDEMEINCLKKIILDIWINSPHKKDFFPAPQPVSLERRDLPNLIKNDYVVCIKSDGMRFLMLCYNGKIYMVDRSFKFYLVSQNFNNEFLYNGVNYTGTYDCGNRLGAIFDGELVKNKSDIWQYVIHDCAYIYGINISNLSFNERYSKINQMFDHGVWKKGVGDFILTTKLFYSFGNLRELMKLIDNNQIDHKIDGLIFTPCNKRICSGTQDDLYKWKPRDLHTFDFKIYIYDNYINNDNDLEINEFIGKYGRAPGKISAYVNNNGTHEIYAYTPPNDVSEKIFFQQLEKNCSGFSNGNIVECDYDEKLDVFKPIKIRNDKSHPNSIFTVKKTLNNIKENITVEELVALSHKVA